VVSSSAESARKAGGEEGQSVTGVVHPAVPPESPRVTSAAASEPERSEGRAIAPSPKARPFAGKPAARRSRQVAAGVHAEWTGQGVGEPEGGPSLRSGSDAVAVGKLQVRHTLSSPAVCQDLQHPSHATVATVAKGSEPQIARCMESSRRAGRSDLDPLGNTPSHLGLARLGFGVREGKAVESLKGELRTRESTKVQLRSANV
jgi:hypothetical protein